MSIQIPDPLPHTAKHLTISSDTLNLFGQHPTEEKAHHIQSAHQDSSRAEMWALIAELDRFRTL